MAEPSDVIRGYELAYGPFVHMSQEEKSVWVRFLQQGGTAYAPFRYDIRVGDGMQMGVDATSYEKNAAYALTTKRIDVMMRIEGILTIVEVKRRAGLSAIGQLIGYRDLVKQTPGFNEPLGMMLIADSLQPDMTRLLSENNINWTLPK